MQPLRYWHLLSLDAPTVAAVWLLTFTVGSGARRHVEQAATLAVTAWLLYVADRLLDVYRGSGKLEARHAFHARHVRRFAVVWVCVLVVLANLVVRLPPVVRAGWLWACLPLLAYAAAVHGHARHTFHKEVAVGAIFALATVLPALVTGGHATSLTVASVAFAGVCWLNGSAIARWEHERRTGLPLWSATRFRAVCLGVTAVALLLTPWAPLLPLFACALSAALLCLLDLLRLRFEAVTLRALADAALLSPLLLVLFIR